MLKNRKSETPKATLNELKELIPIENSVIQLKYYHRYLILIKPPSLLISGGAKTQMTKEKLIALSEWLDSRGIQALMLYAEDGDLKIFELETGDKR